jgi:diguanylate cyclase (GGDEF)-like protein
MRELDEQDQLYAGTIRVLLLGDEAAEAEWISGMLRESKALEFETIHSTGMLAGESLPDPKEIQVVLTLPSFDDNPSHDHLQQVGMTYPDSPVVIIGGEHDEAQSLNALRCGARGFLLASGLDTRPLLSGIVAAMDSHRSIRDLSRARERDQHHGTHDQLTGLANRYLFHDRLRQATAASRRGGNKVALLFLDLDNFKMVNDTLGHSVGDGLLRRVAHHLRQDLRESDTAARVGGDEFALLLTNLRHEADAAQVAAKIVQSLREPIVLKNQSIQCTASIGIATVPANGSEPKELIEKSDTAMYHAKKYGKDRYEFFTDDMNDAVMQRVMLESGLKTSIEREELLLLYQPIFDPRLDRVIGGEALLRWKHPDLGFMAPDAFLPLAEETGQIVQLGEWVLRTACAQNARWQSVLGDGFRISVNISPRQLQEPNFARLVDDALRESGLPAEHLELEIIETSIVQGAAVTLKALHDLKDLGVHLAIDDFGTGYSALSYLKHLPIDALKIDQSFVTSVTSNPADATIIQATMMMAQGLNLSTVAEGVETHDQLLLLASYGCNRMQGYLFGRPAVPEIFERRVTHPNYYWSRKNWQGEEPDS